jgi:hypothetical protein
MQAEHDIQIPQFPALTLGQLRNFTGGRQRLEYDAFLIRADWRWSAPVQVDSVLGGLPCICTRLVRGSRLRGVSAEYEKGDTP